MTDTQPRALVIYYSKTGHTERAAQTIAQALGAETLELTTNRYRMPFFSYLRAGIDSIRGTLPDLTNAPPDTRTYDIVVIGSPVWTSYPATPLRAFLSGKPSLPPATGLFFTNGDKRPPQKAYDMAEQILGKSFAAKTHISNNIDGSEEMDSRIEAFCAEIREVQAGP